MAKDTLEQDIQSGVLLVLALAAVVLLFYSFLFALPVIGVGVAGWLAYKWRHNSASALERKAREHTQALYREALAMTPRIPDREEWELQILRRLPGDLPNGIIDAMLQAALDLYDLERFDSQLPPPPLVCNSVEGARYRDFLSNYTSKVRHPAIADTARDIIVEACLALADRLPSLGDGGDLKFQVPLRYLVRERNRAVQEVILAFFAQEAQDIGVFDELRKQFERNLHEVSGVPFTPQHRDDPKLVLPEDYKGDDAPDVYLKNTPLLRLFEPTLPLSIPDRIRFEHHHIVAGSGHGKTQTLQYLIAQDLERVERGDASIVVVDSQGDMIRNISRLKLFAPGEPLADKLVWIDPEDVEWPLAANLFDAGLDRLNRYSMADRERILNSTIELYSFILRSLLASEMTARQQTLFEFLVRLLFSIPEATIHTFAELLDRDAYDKFKPHIDKLDRTARAFFETDYKEGRYEDTKTQVRSRLWSILRYQTFDRMFSHPKNKIDLFTELQSSKVVLINTAQNLLQPTGAGLFGRFFIAMLARAAEERATVTEPLPTFLYIDEAQDYFDEQFPRLLSQVRKRNIGVVMAHQYVSQTAGVAGLFDAISANTSIKFAGTDSPQDARLLAQSLHTTHDFIQTQPKGTFAAHIRGLTANAVPVSIPFGHLERMDRMDGDECRQVRRRMRERYAVHYQSLGERAAAPPGDLGDLAEAGDIESDPAPTASEAPPSDDPGPLPWR